MFRVSEPSIFNSLGSKLKMTYRQTHWCPVCEHLHHMTHHKPTGQRCPSCTSGNSRENYSNCDPNGECVHVDPGTTYAHLVDGDIYPVFGKTWDNNGWGTCTGDFPYASQHGITGNPTQAAPICYNDLSNARTCRLSIQPGKYHLYTNEPCGGETGVSGWCCMRNYDGACNTESGRIARCCPGHEDCYKGNPPPGEDPVHTRSGRARACLTHGTARTSQSDQSPP